MCSGNKWYKVKYLVPVVQRLDNAIHRAQSLFLALGALVRPGVNFRRTAEILGAELKILGAQLQILGAPTPKE